MKNTFYALTILSLNLTFSLPLQAKLVEQTDLNFKVKSEELMKGDVQYSFNLIKPKKLIKQFPEFHDLDSLSLLNEKGVVMQVSKVAYVINKPIGFFDHQHMVDENYMGHLLGRKDLQKIDENSFQVKETKLQNNYKMKLYFDSDDVSTLSNSRAIQAVSAAKKLDVIAQSAPSTVFSEMTHFSKFYQGAVNVISYTPLKENKTLLIIYRMTAVRKHYASEKMLKPLFVDNFLNQKKQTESFQFEK
jgi:hypothetical protein